MNETIDLMKKHTSVRRFTDEQISDEDLKAIIDFFVKRIPSFFITPYCCSQSRKESSFV